MPAKNFQLVSNDVALINYVYRYRLARIDHLSQLTGRPTSSLYRRLSNLSRSGYLYQKQFAFQKGYYLIGRAALDLLVQEGIASREDLAYGIRMRHHELSELFLKHLSMLTDLHILIELACRRPDSGVRLATWEQGLHITEYVTLKDDEHRRLPFTPDAYFMLERKQRSHLPQRWLYFVEADRSTTTHKRFSQKLEAYSAYFRQGLHRRRYNVPSFRVLTFTLTSARAQNLTDLARESLPSDARRLFYFASLSDFPKPETVLQAHFWSPRAPHLCQRYSFLPALQRTLALVQIRA